MLYEVWVLYRATGKRFLPSQILHEIQNGYKWALDGVLSLESFYGKLLEEVRPKPNDK